MIKIKSCPIIIQYNFQEVQQEKVRSVSRASRQFETFTSRKQKKEVVRKNGGVTNRQESAVYDTFNNMNDGDGNDDWYNHFDHEERDDNLERYDNWNGNGENYIYDDEKDHFANFQFEIKKLNQMYSNDNAGGRQQDSILQVTRGSPRPTPGPSRENYKQRWEEESLAWDSNPSGPRSSVGRKAVPGWERERVRMHRPEKSSVLPLPQTYDGPNNRRVSTSLARAQAPLSPVTEDFTYDDTHVADKENYLQALKDFTNSEVDFKKFSPEKYNPKLNVYKQKQQKKYKVQPTRTSSQDFPFPYQRPVFTETLREKTKTPVQEEELRKKPNNFIDIDESTRILSEPPARRRGVRRVDSVGGESLHHTGLAQHHGGLQAAVEAGARHYQPENYQDPKRLAFQIHGQEGPSSYRFGHDTGIG